jgi:phage terminase small subunit
MALTDKQRRFVDEYLIDINATQAAIRAGYAKSGARTEGARLLANADISAAVEKRLARVAKKADVTVDSLAIELEEARSLALREKQTGAAVSATMGKAKLFGLGVENRRLSGQVHVITLSAKDLDGLTKDELAALERAYPVLQKLGLVGSDTGAEEEARG